MQKKNIYRLARKCTLYLMCSVCGTQLNMTVSRSYLHVIYICLQRYTCVMADDLKGFYMSANGLSIQWKVRMKGELNRQQVMLLLKHRHFL